MSWFEHDDQPLSSPNVTPLVDVALVLLIVFMITAPMMVQGARVELPETQRMDSLAQDQLAITITADGQIQLNDEAIPFEELEAQLSQRMTPGRSVLIYADRTVQHGLFMQVVAIAHALDADIGIPTQPIPDR